MDQVFDVRVDHWCADDEIRALQGCAPFDNSLMQNRYEPTCPSEFYRGYLTPLVGLVQSVGVDDRVERYRWVANEIDETVKTWSGTSTNAPGLVSGWRTPGSIRLLRLGGADPRLSARRDRLCRRVFPDRPR